MQHRRVIRRTVETRCRRRHRTVACCCNQPALIPTPAPLPPQRCLIASRFLSLLRLRSAHTLNRILHPLLQCLRARPLTTHQAQRFCCFLRRLLIRRQHPVDRLRTTHCRGRWGRRCTAKAHTNHPNAAAIKRTH